MTENSCVEKALPPPVEDDRSTKKAHFRDKMDSGSEASPSVSFKDKFMQSSLAWEADLIGGTNDIEIRMDEVKIGHDGLIPSISFSKKVWE